MKNVNTNHPSAFTLLVKSLAAAFSSIFYSSDNREFKRLKDFIAS